MNWSTLKNHLINSSNSHLHFEYDKEKFVNNSFHLTEIKQAKITSVDCGGKVNEWTEIILQLWEPEGVKVEESMKISKAISIIEQVESKLKLNDNAVVKIEYGNKQFHTRQMHPENISVNREKLIISLVPDTTQCKAIDRNEECGKPKVQLAELTTEKCLPSSGCC